MLRVEYVFTILFLAMGPLRTIPVFHALTQAHDRAYRLRAAAYATLIAGVMIAAVALAGVATVESWAVSAAALDIAIGILLIRSTFTTLTVLDPDRLRTHRSELPQHENASPAALGFAPLAAPTIVTPTGVVTIVLFLFLAKGNAQLTQWIAIALAVMLLLNFAGMLMAAFVMRFVRLTVLAVIGWVFAALQVGLAVEVILNGLKLAHVGGA